MPALKISALSELTDNQLVASFKDTGDRQMVGELYRRYHHLIFGACLKQLGNREESKDAAMNIFEKIIVSLPNAVVRSFNSWIYVVIQNECMDTLRSRRKINNIKGSVKQVGERVEKEAKFEGSVRLSTDEEGVKPEEKLIKAMKQLSKEQQKCIRLFFFEEKSYEEIAIKTRFTEKQVKSYLQNGKKRLKKILERS